MDVTDEQVEHAARMAHEANRGYCEFLGDYSQPAWESAPQWQKDSAKNGVRAIAADPTLTPRKSHEGWMKQKTEEGWTYGPVKEPDIKEHPCMVPYDYLPTAQRAKDYIFGAIVRASLHLT